MCIGAFETAQPTVNAPSVKSNGFSPPGEGFLDPKTINLIHIIVASDNPWDANSTSALAEDDPWGKNSPILHAQSPRAVSPPQRRSAPVSSPPVLEATWDSVGAWEEASDKKSLATQSSTSTAALTKEEKAAEMARRKEERKQVCIFYLTQKHICILITNLIDLFSAHCPDERAEKD